MYKKIIVGASAVLALLATTATAAQASTPRRPYCLEVTMPDVIGHDPSTALIELDNRGITDVYVHWNKETTPMVVLASDPTAGIRFYPCLKQVQLFLGE